MIMEIENLPEVSFTDNITLDEVQSLLVEAYQDKYKEITGKEITLRRGDPETLKLYAASVLLFQLFLCVEKAGRMDLLKYSYGAFLDNLGANKGVARLPATPAKTTVRFTLSSVMPTVITIPAGTRVSDGGALYFATDDVTDIPIGETYTDIPCTCLTTGSSGNGVLPGMINLLVDPVPYVSGAVNTELTAGGSDTESDESFAERIYLAPSGYSVAGPIDAYVYHTKSYSSAVGAVEVTSPSPCEVEVRFLMSDGSLPTQSLISEVQEYLSDKSRRPLTDHLTVSAPTPQTFNVSLTYYINRSDQRKAVTVQTEVAKAVDDYITWQTEAIGRDINPSVLTQKVITAGAKRVEITYPVFTTVPAGKVPRVGSTEITYGGLEDD